MERISGWLGAGVVTAGVSAALVAGAGAAQAQTEPGSDAGPTTTSAAEGADKAAEKPDVNRPHAKIAKRLSQRLGLKEAAPADTTTTDKADEDKPDAKRPEITKRRTGPRPSPVADAVRELSSRITKSIEDQEISKALTERADTQPVTVSTPAASVLNRAPRARLFDADADADADAAPVKLPNIVTQALSTASIPAVARLSDAPITEVATAPRLQSLPSALASVVFNVYASVLRVVGGPPALPPGMTTVSVRSSTLEVTQGYEVPADWYFPDGDQPPTRLIYLQHGFLASGPMYSYTAAYLADRTNSIVVAPSLTSNPLAEGGMWLGGAPMHQAVAGLFLGDREALTQSALDAGYDEIYDVADPALPADFVLVGHSLGGGLVSGVAGYYAEAVLGSQDRANHLAGVILLDGVPLGSALPDALVKLDRLELETGEYVPVLELGAPTNLFNSLSTVNQDLWSAREGMFNGVVLDGGTHMDSMQGGNLLIQLAAYVVAGFPQPQNPPAAQEVAIGWIDDMFDEEFDPATGACDNADNGCVGVYPGPGETAEITTPKGVADAVGIDSTPAPIASLLAPLAAAALALLQGLLGTFEPTAAAALVAPVYPPSAGILLDVAA